MLVDGALSVANAMIITCEITNDDIAPTLTLLKEVVNDDGGTAEPADWTLTGESGDSTVEGTTGVSGPIDAGEVTLSESGGPTGYELTGWTCYLGYGTDAQSELAVDDDLVTVGLAENVTCVAENDDLPATLTLLKTVVNDDGGDAVDTDFTLEAAGPTATSGVEGSPEVTDFEIGAGEYVLSETGPDGYTAGEWRCRAMGTDGEWGPAWELTAGALTAENGVSYECEITNNDIAPTLTLLKEVVNDDGGEAVPTDWLLEATLDGSDTPAVSGASGTDPAGPIAVDAGTYALTEADGPDGYTLDGWTCYLDYGTDAQSELSTGDSVTLEIDQDVTCVAVNDDEPATLTLEKVVINDDGGNLMPADFELSATQGDVVISGNGDPTSDGGVSGVEIAAGVWTLDEVAEAGYTELEWSCVRVDDEGSEIQIVDGQAAFENGGDYLCSVTNDDEPVDLELTKDDGGVEGEAGVPFDYTITVTNIGERPIDLDEPVTVVDELPAGMEIVAYPVSGDASCSVAGSVITCDVDPALLGPGASVEIILTVQFPSDAAAGTYVNKAWVTTEDDPTDNPGCPEDESPSPSGDFVTFADASNNVDCEETPLTPHTGLVVVKSIFEMVGGTWTESDGVGSFGATIQYHVEVTASGNAPQTVTITDVLNSQLTYVGDASCQTVTCTVTYDAATRTVTAVADGPINPGETITLVFEVDLPEAPSLQPGESYSVTIGNIAIAKSETTPGTPSNNPPITVGIQRPPGLPSTGVDVAWMLWIALGLMFAGAAVWYIRRSSESSTES